MTALAGALFVTMCHQLWHKLMLLSHSIPQQCLYSHSGSLSHRILAEICKGFLAHSNLVWKLADNHSARICRLSHSGSLQHSAQLKATQLQRNLTHLIILVSVITVVASASVYYVCPSFIFIPHLFQPKLTRI